MVLAREQQLCRPVNDRQQSQGEKRLVRFMSILATGFRWRPHRFQQNFHREVIKAVAPLVVAEDWANDGARIMQERAWNFMTRMVMAKAPRRFGKSVAVAMVIAAIVETLTNSTQAIFSTSRRASKNLLEICHALIKQRGLEQCIIRYNQEELFVKNPNTDEVARIFSYPANAKVCVCLSVCLFHINILFFLMLSMFNDCFLSFSFLLLLCFKYMSNYSLSLKLL